MEYPVPYPQSQFHYVGLGPDMTAPSRNINPLYSNKQDGHSNYFHVNDTILQQLMEQALVETNETARGLVYYQIQERLVEDIFPFIWYYTPIGVNVHPQYLGEIDYLTAPYKILVKNINFK